MATLSDTAPERTIERIARFPVGEGMVRYLSPTPAHKEPIRQMLYDCGSRWPTGWPRNLCPLVDEWYADGRISEFRLARVGPTQIVALCHLGRHPEKADCSVIPNIVALPRYQGMGIGRDLMRWAVARAAREGSDCIELTTWPDNVAPINLYKRVGFVWIPGTEVDMRCFVPAILREPTTYEFFLENDWYRALKRRFEYGPDEQFQDDAPVDTYRFEGQRGDVLTATWEREVGRLIELRWQRAGGPRLIIEGISPDPTRLTLPGPWGERVSPEAMASLRRRIHRHVTPTEAFTGTDEELLQHIGALDADGRLTVAGLLLVGQKEQLEKHVPLHQWSSRHTAAQPEPVEGGPYRTAIALALDELEERFCQVPGRVLLEAIMNAFIHRDYRRAGGVHLECTTSRLEVSNPGEGTPPPRNPYLLEVACRAGLCTRHRTGRLQLMADCLRAGLAAPEVVSEEGRFRLEIKPETDPRWQRLFGGLKHDIRVRLRADHLRVLYELALRPPLTARQAADLVRRSQASARALLQELEEEMGLLEGSGPHPRRRYWLVGERPTRKQAPLSHKQRVMAALAHVSARSRDELEAATGLTRYQVRRALRTLRKAGRVKKQGRGRYVTYRQV